MKPLFFKAEHIANLEGFTFLLLRGRKMIYWKKRDIAFFHIPRTGGTATRLFLNIALGSKGEIIRTNKYRFHEPLEKKIHLLYLRNLKPLMVTNIRNPFEYLKSVYCYIQVHPEHIFKLFLGKELVDLIDSFSFQNFVSWYINNGFNFKDLLVVDGKIPDNLRIHKLETISDDISILLSKIKIKTKFKIERDVRHNKSQRENFICDYTQELKEKVRKKFKWTFDNFYPDV